MKIAVVLFKILVFTETVWCCDDKVIQMIGDENYKGECHHVETKDGYKLMMHRVFQKSKSKVDFAKPPVFLMHGLTATSADWVLLGHELSLSFLLADSGYDVWLGCTRGDTYAMNHKKLDPIKKEFWDFSFHELGLFDLPAMIDRVLMITNSKKLFYVGHSQGTTSLLVLLSTHTEYNEKIIHAHLLSPVTFMNNMPQPLAKRIALQFETVTTSMGMFNYANNEMAIKGSAMVCSTNFGAGPCMEMIFLICGKNKNGAVNVEAKTLPKVFENLSEKTAIKQFSHYLQLVLSNKFRAFDYNDPNINKKMYQGQTSPPDYKLENVSAHLYLYHGSVDLFVSQIDIERMKKLVQNVRKFHVFDNWNHVDFVYGKTARNMLYVDILKEIQADTVLIMEERKALLKVDVSVQDKNASMML